jgi:hypothetical protein
MIGMTMMPCVLLGPPAITGRRQEATQEAEDSHLPGGLKHQPVSDVMPEDGVQNQHEVTQIL